MCHPALNRVKLESKLFNYATWHLGFVRQQCERPERYVVFVHRARDGAFARNAYVLQEFARQSGLSLLINPPPPLSLSLSLSPSFHNLEILNGLSLDVLQGTVPFRKRCTSSSA